MNNWWFILFIIPILIVIIMINRRVIMSVWHKVKSGRAEWDDDWDPFK